LRFGGCATAKTENIGTIVFATVFFAETPITKLTTKCEMMNKITFQSNFQSEKHELNKPNQIPALSNRHRIADSNLDTVLKEVGNENGQVGDGIHHSVNEEVLEFEVWRS
jgi:hypothetical protein